MPIATDNPDTLEAAFATREATDKTNVHVPADDRRAPSAFAGDPAPGTQQETPAEGQAPIDEPWLRGYPPVVQETPSFAPTVMRRLLDGDQADVKERMRMLLSQPAFRYYAGTDKEGLRDKVFGWTKEIARQGLGGLAMPKSCGGEDDVMKFMAAFEILGFHDISLVIKFGVQFGLWGGSVLRLGTDYHHQKYLPRHGLPRPRRLLRHDRDRPRLQRRRPGNDRRLRPGDADLRPALADVHRREKLHRQRRRPRAHRHGVRPVGNGRRAPRRPRLRRPHPRRGRPPASRVFASRTTGRSSA